MHGAPAAELEPSPYRSLEGTPLDPLKEPLRVLCCGSSGMVLEDTATVHTRKVERDKR